MTEKRDINKVPSKSLEIDGHDLALMIFNLYIYFPAYQKKLNSEIREPQLSERLLFHGVTVHCCGIITSSH